MSNKTLKEWPWVATNFNNLKRSFTIGTHTLYNYFKMCARETDNNSGKIKAISKLYDNDGKCRLYNILKSVIDTDNKVMNDIVESTGIFDHMQYEMFPIFASININDIECLVLCGCVRISNINIEQRMDEINNDARYAGYKEFFMDKHNILTDEHIIQYQYIIFYDREVDINISTMVEHIVSTDPKLSFGGFFDAEDFNTLTAERCTISRIPFVIMDVNPKIKNKAHMSINLSQDAKRTIVLDRHSLKLQSQVQFPITDVSSLIKEENKDDIEKTADTMKHKVADFIESEQSVEVSKNETGGFNYSLDYILDMSKKWVANPISSKNYRPMSIKQTEMYSLIEDINNIDLDFITPGLMGFNVNDIDKANWLVPIIAYMDIDNIQYYFMCSVLIVKDNNNSKSPYQSYIVLPNTIIKDKFENAILGYMINYGYNLKYSGYTLDVGIRDKEIKDRVRDFNSNIDGKFNMPYMIMEPTDTDSIYSYDYDNNIIIAKPGIVKDPSLSMIVSPHINELERVKELSKDPHKNVGCVIINEGEVIGRGYNTLMSFKDEDDETNWIKDTLSLSSNKHPYIIHAEMGAITDANSRYHDLKSDNIILFSTYLPCIECVKLIISSGIKSVVVIEFGDMNKEKHLISYTNLIKAGVRVEKYINPNN